MKVAYISLFLLAVSASPDLLAQQYGAFTSFHPNEITPGLYFRPSGERFAYQWTMGLPIMIHDRYNDGKSNISYWSIGMTALVGIGLLTGESPQIEADTSTSALPMMLCLLLPVLSNGQLHFNIVPKSTVEVTGTGATVFAGWDTDLFGLRKVVWSRLAVNAGLSFYRIFTVKNGKRQGFGVGLRFGIRKSFDSPEGGRNPLVGFLGIETGIY